MLDQLLQGSRRDREVPTDVGKVHRAPIQECNDSHYVKGADGRVYSFTRIVKRPWDKETDAMYEKRVRHCLVSTHRFYKQFGKLFHFRTNHVPGAHYATDKPEDVMTMKNNPADFQLCMWKPEKPTRSSEKIKPISYVVQGFEEVIHAYERDRGNRFARPFICSKGVGAAMVRFITPGLRLGMTGLPSEEEIASGSVRAYTYDMFGTSMVSHFGAFWDNNPGVWPSSRQSLIRSEIRGYPGLSGTAKVPEWGAFTPVVCSPAVAAEILKDFPRDAKGNIIFPKTKLKAHRKHLEARAPIYKAAARGAWNRVSGEGVARLVVNLGPTGGDGLTAMEQMELLMESIREWCEEYCAPAKPLEVDYPSPEAFKAAEKEWKERISKVEGFQRVPRTFSVMLERDNKNYGGFPGNINLPTNMLTAVVQIPFTEHSTWGKNQMPIDIHGNPARLDAEGKYDMPPTFDIWYTQRQIRNTVSGNGVFGLSGGGLKQIETNIPLQGFDVAEFEYYLTLHYANMMGPEVDFMTYGYDSFQGPVQNAKPQNQANNRSQIYIICANKIIAKDPTKAQMVIDGPRSDINLDPRSAKFSYYSKGSEIINGHRVHRVADYAPGKELMNSEEFLLRRDSRNRWPEYAKNTHLRNLMELYNRAAMIAREIEWVDETKKEGYAVIYAMPGGGDTEGNAPVCNIYMEAIWANWFDDETRKHCKPGQRIRVKSPDLVRNWPVIDHLTDPELYEFYCETFPDFDKMVERGEFLRDPSIFRTFAADLNFKYRFVVRCGIEDEPAAKTTEKEHTSTYTDELKTPAMAYTAGDVSIDLGRDHLELQKLIPSTSLEEAMDAVRLLLDHIAESGNVGEWMKTQQQISQYVIGTPEFFGMRRHLTAFISGYPLKTS